MLFQTNDNNVVFLDDRGEVKGKVEFSDLDDQTVDIDSVYVAPSERGYGLASRLMGAAARHLRFAGKKVKATCPYAQKWFGDHAEYADMLA
ncbi:MAG: GNAT family N-acetyltransferase [Atopobiaceae bacterium]